MTTGGEQAIVGTQTLEERALKESRELVKGLQEKLVVTEKALRVAEEDLKFQKEKFRDSMVSR